MAPDAEKLRQRKRQDVVAGSSTNNEDPATNQATDRIVTLARLGGTEIAVDGIVYDIKDFAHPGGESILLFGGNDVTVQYRMIHPYHTAKHLEKMKPVGTLANHTCEYKFGTPFELEMKKEVFKIVHRGREFGTLGWYARAFLYIGLFFGLQIKWVTSPTSFALAILYGVSQAFIGLNVQHDANHGAASRTPWINHLLGLGADFIGGSKWLWLQQHWTHHTFTNHSEKDPDMYGAEPMVLFNDYAPGHPKRTFIHRFQAFYYVIVSLGYWLSSVFSVRVLGLQQQGDAVEVEINLDNPYTRKSRKYAVMLRLLYIYTNIIAPIQNQGFSWMVVAHIMVMGASGSLVLAILFAISHNFENADRDPTQKFRSGGEPVCWFKSQVETSSSYGGFISCCLTGGLNFQVEHHLFPRMSSAWYPYIAPTVRRVCEKHGVRYVYYPWVWQNLISTLKYLHQAGTGSNWKNGNPYSGEL